MKKVLVLGLLFVIVFVFVVGLIGIDMVFLVKVVCGNNFEIEVVKFVLKMLCLEFNCIYVC